MIKAMHHVQLAMPKGGEDQARAFYIGVLGFDEVKKPACLRARGGVWLSQSGVEVHLGVEEPFAPAKKAHPAFEVAELERAVKHLTDMGLGYHRDVDLPKIRRIYVDDPFGNRIELLETV
ncbi:VOC family protein [Qingshengfaniella alkalisoli]|uniref:Glyoxalase n=1 Tax=Qingshengfaniella alkalisoli TaxID=2599296 RepID=A0A5B8I516_9RHOB|nr:VOC family protein [Qingshengfaniella alkalisoli]QDY68305.1 glyoxalase [Qingshengfaniella alkalisoli]